MRRKTQRTRSHRWGPEFAEILERMALRRSCCRPEQLMHAGSKEYQQRSGLEVAKHSEKKPYALCVKKGAAVAATCSQRAVTKVHQHAQVQPELSVMGMPSCNKESCWLLGQLM